MPQILHLLQAVRRRCKQIDYVLSVVILCSKNEDFEGKYTDLSSRSTQINCKSVEVRTSKTLMCEEYIYKKLVRK